MSKHGKLYPLGSFNSNSYVKVYDHTVTGSAVTSLTISGLNGNLLTNSDFETWTAGASAAPDGWTSGGAGPTIAREGTTIKLNTYSLKLTGGSNMYLYQDLANAASYIGSSMTFGAWIKSSTASSARLQIAGNQLAPVSSSYHTGGGNWEWLSVTATIPASEDLIRITIRSETANASYYDGAICMEASTVPITTSSNIGLYCLNGDTAGKYLLKARFVNGYNGASYPQLRLNNDSGNTYGYQHITGANTTGSAGRDTSEAFAYLSAFSTLGEIGMSETEIHAKSGYVRTLKTKMIQGASGTTVSAIAIYGYSWNNTADNITSLVVLADQTGGLGVGTVVEVWCPFYSV